MDVIVEQGDTEGAVHFHDFLFKSVQILILTCSCFFSVSAGPTAGPDGAGARALKLTLTYERSREAGRGGRGGEEGDRRNRYAISVLIFTLFFFFCSTVCLGSTNIFFSYFQFLYYKWCVIEKYD